ncbi:MAG: HlyC/CorC family transporter [Bacteroidetes bacterium]|nr:HlyC/CorC family transporter [Bacteroidota bacterium]MBV6461104.1 hypothetical protein [Flavobacteriales bacterium]WKZ75498.1 MAG: hemolysin family protein [Vicingaceae bacterium]MCL4815065.1 hemolysin family protein [Flavobacteriales bacterium]NOG94828.1 HlyC/CorC family transporter [Bacteroidota bacterium]
MDTYLIPALFVSLIFSAIFSGLEIAFVSANKLKIELDSKQGMFSAKIYSRFLKTPSYFIATMLVGNNIALVIYGIVMAILLEPYIGKYIHSEIVLLLAQTGISTALVLIVAEFLPKVFFRINPNKTLAFFAIPVFIIYYALYPIVIIFTTLSEFILTKFFKQDSSAQEIVFGKLDLGQYIEESTENTKDKSTIDHEVTIFRNALDFSNVKARECMVPRIDITAVELNESIETIKQKFIETGFSKILVYRDNVDNMIGYIHSFELFKKPESIKSILLPLLIVPESMPASEALSQFIAQHRSMALVVDEFGGTSGILTIEDVIEQIFGEIEDEHDTDELTEQKISEIEYLFSARHEIKYLNEKYQLKLPESDEYETLAGLIIHLYESIPGINERILTPIHEFTIKKVAGNRIDLVKLKFRAKA